MPTNNKPPRLPHTSPISLLLFLLTTQVHSLTDMTTLNCPDGFTVAVANTSSPAKERVRMFFSLYDGQEHQKRVESIVIQGDTKDLDRLIS